MKNIRLDIEPMLKARSRAKRASSASSSAMTFAWADVGGEGEMEAGWRCSAVVGFFWVDCARDSVSRTCRIDGVEGVWRRKEDEPEMPESRVSDRSRVMSPGGAGEGVVGGVMVLDVARAWVTRLGRGGSSGLRREWDDGPFSWLGRPSTGKAEDTGARRDVQSIYNKVDYKIFVMMVR